VAAGLKDVVFPSCAQQSERHKKKVDGFASFNLDPPPNVLGELKATGWSRVLSAFYYYSSLG
jgi:hypothetical protein